MNWIATLKACHPDWSCLRLANGILVLGFFIILRQIHSRLRLAVLFVREKTLANLFVRGCQRQRILGRNENVRGCELANHNVNWAKNYLSRTRFIFLLILAGFFGLFAVGMVFAAKAHKKMITRMGAFAERMGFVLLPGARKMDVPRITGVMRGKQVEFFNYVTGSGKSRTHWVAVAVTPAVRVALTFRITKQGFISKLQSLFGAKEITVGDKAFDDRWFIETNKPDFFRAALLPEVRMKIDAAAAAARKHVNIEFKLEEGRVRYAEIGTFSEETLARYEAMLPLLWELADLAELEQSM
jgi:hypothetical protein